MTGARPPEPRADATERSTRLWWSLALALTVATVYLSLGPEVHGAPASWASDKVWHAAFYAALNVTYLAATRGRTLAVSFGLFAFGVSMELLQATRPHRDPSLLDALADLAGIGVADLGALLWWWLRNP